ncbi:hypothetical protein V6N13_057827 [Hibiscus sabdariffa]|uniref:Ribosomal protein eL8/eL30/eS12/Gadd45 domain-containing protein n=1 Tax=Hibiscus sabdariffa TaxID=183260 RepID=A0ABR2GHZ2_9ROSI
MELSNVVIFAGECRDTDYKALLGGVHKTVILKGIGNSALKLHSNRSYPLEHVLPSDSFNILQAEGKLSCRSQPDSVKLVKALCADHNVKLLHAPSSKTLGEWAGDYGEQHEAVEIVQQHKD